MRSETPNHSTLLTYYSRSYKQHELFQAIGKHVIRWEITNALFMQMPIIVKWNNDFQNQKNVSRYKLLE